jgi:hypothetical protein
MIQEDYVFVADVVVIDPKWETMVLNAINWLIGADAKCNAIIKICKYKGLHEGHHFILMAMEVYNTFGHDMGHFIQDCAHLF